MLRLLSFVTALTLFVLNDCGLPLLPDDDDETNRFRLRHSFLPPPCDGSFSLLYSTHSLALSHIEKEQEIGEGERGWIEQAAERSQIPRCDVPSAVPPRTAVPTDDRPPTFFTDLWDVECRLREAACVSV